MFHVTCQKRLRQGFNAFTTYSAQDFLVRGKVRLAVLAAVDSVVRAEVCVVL